MTFNKTLYQFQSEDVEFMLEHPRCINANAMGTGKTIEALNLIHRTQPKHVLVIVPKTLIPEWSKHIKEVLNQPCTIPNGQGDRLKNIRLESTQIVCINYDLLAFKHYKEELCEIKWDMIILDEAHKLKNPRTKSSRAAFQLVSGVPRVVLLTGTPQQNGPQDLYSLMHISNPKVFKSYSAWVSMFCEMKATYFMQRTSKKRGATKKLRRVYQIAGAKNQAALRKILASYMTRREKHEVLPDLPPKQHRLVPVMLSQEERSTYTQMKKELFALLDNGELITAPVVIAQLIRLRQICLDTHLLSKTLPRISSSSTKTQTLLDIIDGSDNKLVVFSFFEQYIRLLTQELTKRKIEHVTITGQEKGSERAANRVKFQTDEHTKVCLGTIGAMGVGLDLFAASTCVFTDIHWNPKQNEQAEDRLHRIGQKNNVLIIQLCCQNTVEEHINSVVCKKEEMFNEIIVRKKVIDHLRTETLNI